MVSFENVDKFILSDINLCIPQGVIAGVIGRSGSGKTTLLHLACGLLACERGNVRTFAQNPVKRRRQIASDICFFSSGHSPFREDSTILDEFQRLRTIYRVRKDKFWKQYEELAEKLCFKEYEKKEIRQLSLGQRRRAELATALLGTPRLILLDEPTAGVDELGKQIFREELQKKKECGITVMIASENMTEIELSCDRVILLDEGKLLYYGSKERLMRRYAPIHEMEIFLNGRLPDMEDLPLIKYSIDNNRLKFQYNENVISAVEIIRHIAVQTSIAEMNIIGPGLEDVILMRKGDVKQ